MLSMSYRQCPVCRANNRSSDRSCYSCGEYLEAIATSQENAVAASVADGQRASSLGIAATATGLTAALAGAGGFLCERLEMDLGPWLMLALSALSGLGSAALIGLFQGLPGWKWHPRLPTAGLAGALAGMSVFAVWWGFDLSIGSAGVAALGGGCAAWSTAVSFGLMGGESRAPGWTELANLASSLVLGLILIFPFVAETEEVEAGVAMFGLAALLPLLAGGRFSLLEVAAQLRGTGDDSGSWLK